MTENHTQQKKNTISQVEPRCNLQYWFVNQKNRSNTSIVSGRNRISNYFSVAYARVNSNTGHKHNETYNSTKRKPTDEDIVIAHIWKGPAISNNNVLISTSTDNAVVKTLASHQCVPGTIIGPDIICGLSLLLVLYSAVKFFFGHSSFSLSSKTQHFQLPIRSWNAWASLHKFLWAPWCLEGKQITYYST